VRVDHGRASRRGALHPERATAHAHRLAAPKQRLQHRHAVHEGPVGRVQIREQQALVLETDAGVAPRYLRVGQLHITGRPDADQDARRAGRVQLEALAGIRPFRHLDRKGGDDLFRVHPLSGDCRVVVEILVVGAHPTRVDENRTGPLSGQLAEIAHHRSSNAKCPELSGSRRAVR